MTQTTPNTTRTSQERTPSTPRQTPTAALRDLAFVLHLTRRVRAEILSEGKEPALVAV